MSGLLSLPDEFFGHSARLAGVPRYQGVAGNVSTICNGHCYWMARCTLFFFKGAVMNIRQSRLLKLVLSGVLALSALLGTGSALAYSGSWTSVAIEGQPFSYQDGDFVRYGRTDSAGCPNSGCPGLWSYKGFTGSGTATCSNQYWGGDPYPNQPKNCEKLTYLGGLGAPSVGIPLKFVAVEGNPNPLAGMVTNSNSGCQTATVGSCDRAQYIGWTSNGSAYNKSAILNNTMTCNSASFGGDPINGALKYCFFPR